MSASERETYREGWAKDVYGEEPAYDWRKAMDKYWDWVLMRATREPQEKPRVALLDEASDAITGDRNESYGEPTQNFQDTADVWNVQFRHLLREGAEFKPAHVAQAMIGLKLVRMIKQPKRDNYLDIAGYAACGWECEEAAA